jgi:hypothetical protein
LIPRSSTQKFIVIVDSFRSNIKSLLLDGKRSNHPDFQLLFRIYGKDICVQIAKEELEMMNLQNKKGQEQI